MSDQDNLNLIVKALEASILQSIIDRMSTEDWALAKERVLDGLVAASIEATKEWSKPLAMSADSIRDSVKRQAESMVAVHINQAVQTAVHAEVQRALESGWPAARESVQRIVRAELDRLAAGEIEISPPIMTVRATAK